MLHLILHFLKLHIYWVVGNEYKLEKGGGQVLSSMALSFSLFLSMNKHYQVCQTLSQLCTFYL